MEEIAAKNISAARQLNSIVTAAQIMGESIVINDAVRSIRRFMKQTLTRLEADGILTPAVRKHVLDGFGDAERHLLEQLLPLQS